MIVMIPMPYIAVETGWITAETGRQPWIVYGLLKTSDALSPTLPVEYVGFSLIIFSLVYLSFFFLLAKWLPRIIRESLEEHVSNSPLIVEK
jgi:cytochrome d ubiquinol oxidase subunit I